MTRLPLLDPFQTPTTVTRHTRPRSKRFPAGVKKKARSLQQEGGISKEMKEEEKKKKNKDRVQTVLFHYPLQSSFNSEIRQDL